MTAKTLPNVNKKSINKITVVSNRSKMDEHSVSKMSATSKTDKDNFNQRSYHFDNNKEKVSESPGEANPILFSQKLKRKKSQESFSNLTK